MEGEEEASNEEGSFSRASTPKRIAIVVAGAMVNIIFAVIVYFILIATSGTYISNEVESTVEGYVSKIGGIQLGDKIISIDDKKVKSKYDLDKIMAKNNGEEINVKIDRNGEIIDIKLIPTEVKTKVTGIYLDENAKIITMDKDSSSKKAGIENNDIILEINGEEVNGSREKAIEILNKEEQNEDNQNENNAIEEQTTNLGGLF